MGMISFRCLFVLFAFAALAEMGNCLECFSCSSSSRGVCGDKFGPHKVAASLCKPKENLCFKGSVAESGATLTKRGCTIYDPCDHMTHCYTCTKDQCNSSSRIAPPFMIFTIATAILIKLLM